MTGRRALSRVPRRAAGAVLASGVYLAALASGFADTVIPGVPAPDFVQATRRVAATQFGRLLRSPRRDPRACD